MNNLPKMRTIDEAIAEIKEQDPKSGVTKFAIRSAINKGELPSVSMGRKKLIDMENLGKWLVGCL